MSDGSTALYGMCYAGPGTSNSLGGLTGRNDSTDDVVVFDSVAAGTGQEVEVREAYVVLFGVVADQAEVFGSGFVLPPDRDYPDGAAQVDEHQMELWEQRIPLEGAELGPGESFNLIVGVAPTVGDRGSSDGLEIRYHVGSQQYSSYPGIGADFLSPDECK
ncbi:MAG: hypothetical protein LBS27_00110 [Bifidobacteriaceae bacterium]|jgi:hypothetical protein|nr:hypothetical protein [Bifidobacteriaceae bacterium]